MRPWVQANAFGTEEAPNKYLLKEEGIKVGKQWEKLRKPPDFFPISWQDHTKLAPAGDSASTSSQVPLEKPLSLWFTGCSLGSRLSPLCFLSATHWMPPCTANTSLARGLGKYKADTESSKQLGQRNRWHDLAVLNNDQSSARGLFRAYEYNDVSKIRSRKYIQWVEVNQEKRLFANVLVSFADGSAVVIERKLCL